MKKMMLFLMLMCLSSFKISNPKETREETSALFVMKDDWSILIEALIQVESEGDRFAVGKANDVGVLQITPIYLKEVNRILQEDVYTLSERTDIDKSIEMFEIYQSHHNPSKNIEKAIMLHNPRAGKSYLNKVLSEFNKIKQDSTMFLSLEKNSTRSIVNCKRIQVPL